MMVVAKLSIDVEASADEAYGQWARFEELPRFMEGVREVQRVGRHELRWVADLCGRPVEWKTEITEETPGRQLAWRSRGGRFNSGKVTFTKLDGERTRVDLRLEYDPKDLANALVDQLNPSPGQFEDDLECFKEMLEQ